MDAFPESVDEFDLLILFMVLEQNIFPK